MMDIITDEHTRIQHREQNCGADIKLTCMMACGLVLQSSQLLIGTISSIISPTICQDCENVNTMWELSE